MRNKLILLAATLTLATVACGPGDAQSGGPLTTPTTSDATVTSTTVPPTSVTTAPGETTTTPPTTRPESSEVTIYLLNESGQAIPTTRTVTTEGVARAALQALIDGPTPRERTAGLSTAFPADSLILGITIDGGTATVDMSREFEAGGGSFAILGRLAQFVYTLTEFDSIDRVDLLLDGEEIEYFSGEGVIVGDGWTRSDFSGSNPIGDPLDGTGPATWEQSDLPPVDLESNQARTVVLVAADDYLNVREPAGASETIIGRLLPGALVNSTGSRTEVGGSTWNEIETPTGTGWVNGLFLAPTMDDFPAGSDPGAVVDEFVARLALGEDFTDFVSDKGLWVAHHADPIRFRTEDLTGILDDPTTYRWGSPALEPGSPEIEPRTFAEAVAAPLVDVHDDPDLEVAVGDFIEGPNGRPADFAVPVQFQGFPYVTLFDPGDDPQFEGLDWMSWVVSMSYEDGGLRVVGLTVDQWSP
jgi:hypothetical protein